MKNEDVSQANADGMDSVNAMSGKEESSTETSTSDKVAPNRDNNALGVIESEVDHNTKPAFDEDNVDPIKGAEFSACIVTPGEQLVPLKLLMEWIHHPANGSRTQSDNAAGLIASATNPVNIPPIVILPAEDGFYPILDGRLRWHAFREAHGDDSDIKVRCVMFSGTEAEAVQAACDDALGGTPRSAIESARAVLNVQRVAGISQKAIAERYPVLKKDQVSRMTIAARAVEKYPIVFNLLEEPDRVSIDLCVKFAQFMKAASEEERENALDAADFHASEGASLKRNELLEALGIETESENRASAKADPLAPIEMTEIFGADDQVVGALEMLNDDVMRIRLPDPATMTVDEREAAAASFIRQIRAYFFLDTAE